MYKDTGISTLGHWFGSCTKTFLFVHLNLQNIRHIVYISIPTKTKNPLGSL